MRKERDVRSAYFEVLYETYEKHVRNTAYKIMGDTHDSEDITQDVFIQTIKSYETLHNPAAIKRWLTVTTKNRCYRVLEKRKVKMVPLQDIDFEPVVVRTEEIPELYVAEKYAFMARMEGLKASQKDATYLYYYHDLPIEEVAKIMNRPQGTVKTILKRSRQLIAEHSDQGNEMPPQLYYLGTFYPLFGTAFQILTAA